MNNFFHRPPLGRRHRLLVLAVALLYIILFLPLYQIWGIDAAALSFLPVAGVAWVYGRIGGAMAGVIALFVHTLLLYLVGVEANLWLVFVKAAKTPGSLILIISGWAIGWLRDSKSDYGKELQSALIQLLTQPAVVEGDLDQALPLITAAVADALPVDRAAVWRLSADGRYLLCLSLYRRSDQSHTAGERIELSRYPHYVAAFNKGLTLVAKDTFNDRRTQELRDDYWQPNNVRAAIEAPIWLYGKVAGVLCLEHQQTLHAWNASEIAFATRAAEVVVQAFLNADIHRRAEELATLQWVSADIMTMREMPALLKMIVQRAAFLLAVSAGELYLAYPDKQKVRRVVSYGVEEDANALLPYGQGAAGIVAQTGQPLIIDNYQDWPDRLEPERVWKPFMAVLSVPLTRQGQVTGVINIVGYGPDKQFTEANLQLLTLFANHAAVSLENAQLIRKTEEQARTANLLNQVITVAVSSDSEGKVLEIVCRQLTHFFGASRAGIAVLDEDGAYETVVAEYSADLFPSAVGQKIPVTGNPAMQTLFLSGAPLVIADVLTHPITAPVSEMLQERNIVSMLLVPILVQGQVVGTLGIDADRTRLFTPEEIALAQIVGEKIGQILETVRLYERLHRYTAELEDRVSERTYKLAEANRQLRHLDRLKSKFISDMSHELRTPISSIVLFLDLMERGKPEKQAHYLTRLKSETSRLVDLIEGALNITRMEMDQDKVTYERVSLKALLDQIIDSHKTRANLSGLDLVYQAEDGLPPVRGNSGWLFYMINNLLTNAIRYTESGEVRVHLYRKDNCICLEVADTGPGIDPEEIPYLFDRFYRGNTVSQSNTPGAGLGLAIVKETVELHNGHIQVESELGKGSLFRVCLPL